MSDKPAAKKTAAPAKTAAAKAKASGAAAAKATNTTVASTDGTGAATPPVTVAENTPQTVELTPDQQAANDGAAAEAAIALGTDPNLAAAAEGSVPAGGDPNLAAEAEAASDQLPKEVLGRGGVPKGFAKVGDDDVMLRATHEVLVEFVPSNVTRPSRVLIAAKGAEVARETLAQRLGMYADANGFKIVVSDD